MKEREPLLNLYYALHQVYNGSVITLIKNVPDIAVTNHYPPPDNVYVADARTGTLVFNWTPVISNCSTAFLQYSITSDCGACPTVTNLTTATCSDLQLSTNAVMCQFSVSSHACGLVGNSSSPTAVTLKGINFEVRILQIIKSLPHL